MCIMMMGVSGLFVIRLNCRYGVTLCQMYFFVMFLRKALGFSIMVIKPPLVGYIGYMGALDTCWRLLCCIVLVRIHEIGYLCVMWIYLWGFLFLVYI